MTNNIIYNELISKVIKFNNFSTIFYFDPDNARERCQLENYISWTKTKIPVLVWRTITTIQLSQFINTNLLILVCLPGVYRQDLLNTLASSMKYIRQVKVLIELVANQNVSLVSRVFEYCIKNDMLNANLIFGDFGTTKTLYSFEAYPTYILSSQNITHEFADLYPDKTKNFHGFQLRTTPDLSEPNTIFYFDKQRHPRVLGYVWNILEEFAQKHNARLQFSALAVKSLTHIQVLDYTRDGLLDVAASIQPMSLNYLDRFHQYSYPVYVSSWCTMLPRDPPIPIPEVYPWMISIPLLCYLSILWMIHELVRDRWRRHCRLQTIGWLVLATFLMCEAQGRLIKMFVAPNESPLIKSFQEMLHSERHIFGFRTEYSTYEFDMRTKYASVFYISENYTNLMQMRHSLNTSFAYTVIGTKWKLYASQQELWTRSLFYYSNDMCIHRAIPFALVIPENSPLRAQLNNLILQLGQSGLTKHWVSKSFYYMVQAGRMHIQDPSEPRYVFPLSPQDLQYILHVYAGAMLISIMIFVCELIIDVCLTGTFLAT